MEYGTDRKKDLGKIKAYKINAADWQVFKIP
jgi:hypothetical protein